MKLHKKILTHFLSCTSPVDKEGYLYKKKKRNGIYNRRWFVLKANLLFYQERPADRHLLGVIVLEGATVWHMEADVKFAFSLAFQGPGLKTYRFAAADRESQESWVRTLVSASHGYLSLLLRDLRGQYEEATKQEGSSSCLTPPPDASAPPPELGAAAVVRKGRSQSAIGLLQAPAKASGQKGPTWLRKNALITPLNGPAAPIREWPLAGASPAEDFRKLHDSYGEEVKKAREEWLKGQRDGEEGAERDLIDLG